MWITGLTRRVERWAAETESVYRLAAGYYRDVVEKEVILADITEGDSILCIGGGACPFSAILFHEFTGARVTVIDNNASCARKAGNVIERLGLGGRVRVFCKDGGSAAGSFSGYSVIHFALQVRPMERVFSRVESRAAAGTKLLVREPRRQLKKFYSEMPGSLKPRLCPLTTHGIGSTFMYVKQGVGK